MYRAVLSVVIDLTGLDELKVYLRCSAYTYLPVRSLRAQAVPG